MSKNFKEEKPNLPFYDLESYCGVNLAPVAHLVTEYNLVTNSKGEIEKNSKECSAVFYPIEQGTYEADMDNSKHLKLNLEKLRDIQNSAQITPGADFSIKGIAKKLGYTEP